MACIPRSKGYTLSTVAIDRFYNNTLYQTLQEGLLPIRDRVYREVVDKYYWDKSFCDAKPESMEHVLSYIKKR